MRRYPRFRPPVTLFHFTALALFLSCLGLSLPAHAGLGDKASSVTNDNAAMHGTLRSVENENYTMHEIAAGNGSVVHEYVSTSGTVFAVTYNGPTMPDFTQLLASYSGRLAQAQQNRQARRQPIMIDDSDFVLHVSGRMRAFHVVSYLPSQIPAAMRADEIQ